jgi:hypothetical protein
VSNKGWAVTRAVRGPLILICLGVLFAVDQAGGTGFHRTWPVLLVLYGVMKLVERLLAPPVVSPPGPPSWPPAPPPGTPGAPGAWQPPQGGYGR